MRITEAATRLGTSPRMLRYRDLLGLLPPVREAAREAAREPRTGGAQIRGTRAANGSTPRAGSRSAPRRGAPGAPHFHRADPTAASAGPGVREGAGAAAAEPHAQGVTRHAWRRGPNRRRVRRRTARIAGSVASALDSWYRSGSR